MCFILFKNGCVCLSVLLSFMFYLFYLCFLNSRINHYQWAHWSAPLNPWRRLWCPPLFHPKFLILPCNPPPLVKNWEREDICISRASVGAKHPCCECLACWYLRFSWQILIFSICKRRQINIVRKMYYSLSWLDASWDPRLYLQLLDLQLIGTRPALWICV